MQELLSQNRDLATDNRLLQGRVNELMFGSKKRERWDPDQEALPFEDVEALITVTEEPSATAAVAEAYLQAKPDSKSKRKNHPGRSALSPLLPRRDVRHEMSEDELDEEFGKGNWKVIGQEVTEVLDSEPSSLFVARDTRVALRRNRCC